MNPLGRARSAVIGATTELFSHGPTPLEHTLDYPGDPGLLGPGSVSWRVLGDPAVFVGGIRALVVQAAHPEVVAGVDQHSTYRDDPLGRLSRTSVYVTETTYGAMAEVESAVEVVRGAHAPVTGRSKRGRPYSAANPAMAAWVHNVLTDSFLATHQAFGADRLSGADADRFVAEQTRVGALLGADPMPTTAAELRSWIVEHPDLAPGEAQRRAIGFLRNPPLAIPVRLAYWLLFNAAVTTIDESLQRQLRLDELLGAAEVGRAAVAALRWSLGFSPAWKLALERTGAPIPDGKFRQ